MIDTRSMVAGTITWHEDDSSGRGYLTLQFDDGGSEAVQWDEPITATTDSHFIVGLFDGYDFVSVDHNGDNIHVVVNS